MQHDIKLFKMAFIERGDLEAVFFYILFIQNFDASPTHDIPAPKILILILGLTFRYQNDTLN